MTLTSHLAGRDATMKNKANRHQLSQLLCTHKISAKDYWECTHFQNATRLRVAMHVK